jgi:hypothetical protein
MMVSGDVALKIINGLLRVKSDIGGLQALRRPSEARAGH